MHGAAERASLHEFITGLEERYETVVGRDGARVSGGQAQRLQIARALVREGDVLLLDECTSALDMGNQRNVLGAVGLDGPEEEEGGPGKRKRKATVVVVTHKMEVMRMCDRIVVVDGGKVVEEGTLDQLVGRQAVFAELTRME